MLDMVVPVRGVNRERLFRPVTGRVGEPEAGSY